MSAGTAGTSNRCAGCGAPGAADDRFCEMCGARRDDPRDRIEIDLTGLAGVSDRGHRHLHNEDALALRSLPPRPGRAPVRVAVLCDGVSSTPRPDLASLAAVDTSVAALTELLDTESPEPAAAIGAAAHAAVAAVVDVTAAAGLPSPAACTFVAAVVIGDTATIGWLGDSRAYWLPSSGEPGSRLTVDDSWAARAAAAGPAGSPDAARDHRAHMITAWIGSGSPSREVHIATVRPHSPGALVLCTDGLSNHHDSPESLAAVLTGDPGDDPIRAARELVASALGAGGQDNVTVAVLPIAAAPDRRGTG